MGLLRMRLGSIGSDLQEIGKALRDTPRDVTVRDDAILRNAYDKVSELQDATHKGESLRALIDEYQAALAEQERLSEAAEACGIANILAKS